MQLPTNIRNKYNCTFKEVPAKNFSNKRKTPWFIGPVTKKPVIPRLTDCFMFLFIKSYYEKMPWLSRMQDLLTHPITSKHGH